MAISAQLIGSLGAGKVTESRFWFSSSQRSCSDLDKTWDIPAGRHLFFWQGTRSNYNPGTITIDGTTFDLKSAIKGGYVGGYMYVDGPKTIQATGTGPLAFPEEPYASWVKVAE